jgi:hypothetical protein
LKAKVKVPPLSMSGISFAIDCFLNQYLVIIDLFSAVINIGECVSSKMDFGDDGTTLVVSNSTKVEDEDVEVKHTIVVSTKLKNNNRRGLHARGEGMFLYKKREL